MSLIVSNMRLYEFPQRITPFLKSRLEALKNQYGESSSEYYALAIQYLYNELEEATAFEHNPKHYEAGVVCGKTAHIERLYHHHCCIEISFNCLANCRFCLRSNYNDRLQLSEEEIISNSEYLRSIGAEEVLLTGGDPFLNLKILRAFTFKILETAPTIKIIRIATRVFTQSPNVIKDDHLFFLAKLKERVRVEVATQINSSIELRHPEVQDALRKVTSLGIPVYSQNVFLKGVNSTPEQLVDLYHEMRMSGVEPHYLFHCIPMKGTHHLRTTVHKMIECYEALVNSGQVTGRSKPVLALMTQIGKITLTPFNFKETNDGYVLLRSNYKLKDRLTYNPDWKIPEDAYVDDDGYLWIKYLDGED